MGLMDKHHFERWYEKPLLALLEEPDHRIAAIILGCSILEAAIRTNPSVRHPTVAPGAHVDFRGTASYLDEVQTLFGLLSRDEASFFWQAFRNGFAHKLTFNVAAKSATGVSVSVESEIRHDRGKAIEHTLDTTSTPHRHHFVCRPRELVGEILKYATEPVVLGAMGAPYEYVPPSRFSLSTGGTANGPPIYNAPQPITQSDAPPTPPPTSGGGSQGGGPGSPAG